MKRLSYALLVVIALGVPANAAVVLFDFNNGPQYRSLPLDLTVGGVTAHLSATGSGFSIQDTAQGIGVLPAGFSGLGIYPNSVFAADLLVSFSQDVLTDFSIMVAPQELATDTTATLKVSAYMNGNLIGTNTSAATGDTFTWPSSTLSFNSAQGFNSVVVHYDSPPPTGGDYGVIFVADNMVVTPLPVGAWTGTSSTNWADIANWSGAVPGAVTGTTNTHTAVFNQNVANSPLNIDAGRNIQSVTFDTASVNSLTVGTTGGNQLLLSSGGTIQTTPTVVNSQTVNAPLVLEGSYTLASNAANSTATLGFGGQIAPAATSGTTTLVLDGSNVGANTIRGALADNGPGQLSVLKTGSGVWTLSGPNAYSGGTYVSVGALRFNITSGTPTIAAGSIATVANGAAVELAGPISALGTAGGNRTQIVNDSTAPGLVVSGTHQVVGGIDGSGDTQVNAGSDLAADHIVQNALIVGGTAGSHGLVTIAASDSIGKPLIGSPSLTDSLAANEPFGVGASSAGSSGDLATDDYSSAVASFSPSGLGGQGNGDLVPEPTTATLLVIAALVSSIVPACRRLCSRRSVE